MYDVIQTPIPTIVNSNDIKLIVSSISSLVALLGSNESITSPIRKTKEGMPHPATTADIHPKYNRVLSEPDAKQYNFEYETEGPKLFVPVLSLLIVESTCLIKTSTGS